MVSNHSDTGQERWLANRGIDLLRGTGRLTGTGVIEVDGVSHTAKHVVVATGADPFVPAIAGLRELEGVWGPREATSGNAVPRRMLVLGGGPAGIERAQVVRRLGGEAVVLEGADRLLPREPAPLGKALGEAPQRDGIELAFGRPARRRRVCLGVRRRHRSGALRVPRAASNPTGSRTTIAGSRSVRARS